MASARRFAAQPSPALLLLFLLASSLIGMAAGDPDKAKAQRKVRPAAGGSAVLFCYCCQVCCCACAGAGRPASGEAQHSFARDLPAALPPASPAVGRLRGSCAGCCLKSAGLHRGPRLHPDLCQRHLLWQLEGRLDGLQGLQHGRHAEGQKWLCSQRLRAGAVLGSSDLRFKPARVRRQVRARPACVCAALQSETARSESICQQRTAILYISLAACCQTHSCALRLHAVCWTSRPRAPA